MQRFGLDLDQAFEVLRRYSQTYNVKLRQLAENLVRAGGIPLAGDGTADGTRTLTESLGIPADETLPAG